MLECDFIACLWVHCKAKGEDGWGGGEGEGEEGIFYSLCKSVLWPLIDPFSLIFAFII